MIPSYSSMIDMEKTARHFKELRESFCFRIQDLQNYFGFSTPQTIYKWEEGRSLPNLDNLFGLSRLYGCHLEELLVYFGNEAENDV